jgi:SPP1 gp7 family putative phage head morphogenesis protein
LPRLIAALEPAFGPERAAVIAATENTRLFSYAEQAAGDADPDTVAYRFLASADERVCPACGPLHGALVEKGASGFVHPSLGRIGFPPLHPNCRCSIAREGRETVAVPVGEGGAGNWRYTGPPAVPSDRVRRGN